MDNIPGPMTLTDGPDRPPPSVRLPVSVRMKIGVKEFLKRHGLWMPRRITFVEGKRHERLREAQAFLASRGRALDSFKVILAVVRNPYDLEVSRYHFLRKGLHGVRGLAQAPEQRLAQTCGFEEFAGRAPFHGRIPAQIELWYELKDGVPANMRLARFEALESDLEQILAPFYALKAKLRHLNASEHGPYREYLTPAAEEAIYRKYQWLFDRGFYPRESL